MPVYKDKLRNTWYFRVYIEDFDGSKKQKSRSGFSTKREAQEEEQAFLSKYNSDFQDITFQELYEVFIKQKEQDLKSNSIRALKSRYNLHILPFFKNYRLSKITNITYINWKEKILQHNFSFKYNASLHTCMVSILNYAMDFYGLEKNIATKVGNFSKKNYIPKVDFWTYEEFNQFISVVNDYIYQSLFTFLYYTGMRLGECLALNWNDIQEDYIDITKSISKEQNNGNYIITTPKTPTSIRKIKLDHKTLEMLQQLKNYYQNFIGFNNKWFIFGGMKPLAQSTIGRKKNEYCKLANVKKIKIHDFRHSHATLLLSNGVPITVICERLGHADKSMTLNVYSHLIKNDENKAVEFINNLRNE